jgi:excinuclease UvrABC nuclease subunit
LPICLGLVEGEPADERCFRSLPAKPGVLVIEAADGSTLSLLTTADLRRAAVARLGPPARDTPPSPRPDLRGIARNLRAVTVGSAFEADWAYLQLARSRLPDSYRHVRDRWQAWFVHCDAGVPFPQWLKSAQPVQPASSQSACVGPFPDKHVAHRFIEMIEDAFDLCRYHHVLIQAPHATACAYKEMGRCPAPCDGSIDMQRYLQQVRDSITFARQPIASRQRWQADMVTSSARMDFEAAQRSKNRLDRTASALKPQFAHVRDIDEFRFLAVLPGERANRARLMIVIGGDIWPLVDLSQEFDANAVVTAIQERCAVHSVPMPLSEAEIENIGLACRHLLAPRAQARRRRAAFLRLPDDLSVASLSNAVALVIQTKAPKSPQEDLDLPSEQELEAV